MNKSVERETHIQHVLNKKGELTLQEKGDLLLFVSDDGKQTREEVREGASTYVTACEEEYAPNNYKNWFVALPDKDSKLDAFCAAICKALLCEGATSARFVESTITGHAFWRKHTKSLPVAGFCTQDRAWHIIREPLPVFTADGKQVDLPTPPPPPPVKLLPSKFVGTVTFSVRIARKQDKSYTLVLVPSRATVLKVLAE